VIQDPSGILTRVPELETLAHLPSIRRAIESGNPFRVYRALLWVRVLNGAGTHAATVKALLANRRLFARPLSGSPWLGTFNSVGATFVGESERDTDGTWIATHALVIGFLLPLVPFGAYVVRKVEDNGVRSSWNIFARVPLGPFFWLWNRVAAVGAIASVLVAGAGALHAARYQKVRVINGFSAPAQVSIGNATTTVPGASDAVIEVPTGRHAARAIAGDIVLDALDLDVTPGADVFAWNIAGAAPVYSGEVVYQAAASKANGPDPAPRIYCAQRVVVLRSVDYAFRPPERTMSVPKDTGRRVMTHAGYVRGENGGPRSCASILARENRMREALPFLETEARLSRWDAESTYLALHAARAVSPEETLRVARAARDARPDDVEAQRRYQWTAEAAGRQAESVEEYGRRAQAEPDSADAQYLYARLIEGPEGRALVEALLSRFPDHAYLLRLQMHYRFCAGDWAGASASWEQLRAKAPRHAAEMVNEELWALAAQKKLAKAVQLARDVFPTAPERIQSTVAERFARLARLQGSKAPDELIQKVETRSKGQPNVALRQRAGLPIPADARMPALQLYTAATRDPASGMRMLASATELDVFAVAPTAWILLYFEAVRSASAEAQKSLSRTGYPLSLDRQGMREFLRGQAVSIDDIELDPEVRALALVVRARNASLSASERRALLARARSLDVVHGMVSEAIAGSKI
jgi:hypothetical protein